MSPVDEHRLDLVHALNGAEANLAAAEQRAALAAQALEVAEEAAARATAEYSDRRAVLFAAAGPDARIDALRELHAAMHAMPDVRAALQRARAERGTANALHQKRLAEAVAAAHALEKAIPEEAP